IETVLLNGDDLVTIGQILSPCNIVDAMNLRIEKTNINDAHYRLPSLPQTNNIHAVNNFINSSRIFPPSFMTRLLLIILLQSHLMVPQISGAIPPRYLTGSRVIAHESVGEDPMYKSHLGKASFRALSSQSDHEQEGVQLREIVIHNSKGESIEITNKSIASSSKNEERSHCPICLKEFTTEVKSDQLHTWKKCKHKFCNPCIVPCGDTNPVGLFCGGLSDLVDQGPGAEADEIRAFGSLAHRIHEPC
ncbi:hypothetical protein MJO29_012449, partial [Puccinia striiformis f. sp. tritici]